MTRTFNETIDSAIAHLNGYVLILEEQKNIPAPAVKETIEDLRKLKKRLEEI